MTESPRPTFLGDCGILLHPTSLPGPFAIGDIGPAAMAWLYALVRMGQSLWQVLPLNPPDQTQSPYQARSAFANDVRLVSPEWLVQHGLLAEEQLADFPSTTAALADFGLVHRYKLPLVRRAAEALLEGAAPDLTEPFEQFSQAQRDWLGDYALFSVLSEHFEGRPWTQWPRALASRTHEALLQARRKFARQLRLVEAEQFLFECQWRELHACAADLGIRIIGDLPIFVAHNSADVWAHRELFSIDPQGQPLVVAGVPPDYFSKTGQRWGNPLYDWSMHEAQGFSWWISRVERALALTDVVRIDHFRGFEAYWEIPAEAPTAQTGRWAKAPGASLFRALTRALGGAVPIIAEDLGLITDEVKALKQQFGFPGMRVLQFSFGGDPKDLPDTYDASTVAYTGTHDNDTLLGWHSDDPTRDRNRSAEEILTERDRVRRYFSTDGAEIHWTCIRGIMATRAAAVIYPLQDVLGQGSEARMNIPGVVDPRNWAYRFEAPALRPEVIKRLRQLSEELGRGQSAQLSHP